MKENIEKLKKLILSILQSSTSVEEKLEHLNNLLGSLNPLENSEEIDLICDAGILLANKIHKTELIAQFFLIKAKAEASKATFFIHENKNLKLSVGWFGFALQSEKEKYDKLENRTQEIWSNVHKYIDSGFTYLKIKPYIGAVGYCQRIAGEVLSTIYLQRVEYYFQPVGSFYARIAQIKLFRFLDLDLLFILDKKSRKIVKRIKKDALRCFDEAIKAYQQESMWSFLAEAYIVLGLEHHSFNSPIRSKISLFRACRLIKKHRISGLDERLKSINNMPLIGSDRDYIEES